MKALQTLIVLLLINSFLPAQEFKFIAMSDSRGMYNGVNDSVLSKLVYHIIENQKDARFVVFPGDMVDGNRYDPDKTVAELEHWKDVMAPIYNNPNMVWPKVWPVVGNHEIQHPKDEDNFRKVFPNVFANGPDDEKGLTYSFDFENTHFVCVNTNRWFYGDPNTYDDDRRDWHYVKHIDWLENDLKEARERHVNHIVFLSHDMIYPVGGHLHDGLANLGRNFTGEMDSTNIWFMNQRQKVIDLMKEYDVAVHICGHEHIYGRQEVNGLYEIIAGSSGAPLYKPNPVYRADADSHYVGEQMSYTNALPYYKALNYFHGPGENSQASRNFVGKSAFHYVALDVKIDRIEVKTYGAYPSKEKPKEMGTEIKLIDEFVIFK